MSIDIVTSLMAATAASGVTQQIWNVLKKGLQEKGVKEIPAEVITPQQRQQAEEALVNQASRFEPEEARIITMEALSKASMSANSIRVERMRQAKITFNAAIILAVVGVLLIFAGVALVLFKDAEAAGAVTAGVGAVTEVISALLFKLNHDTNNRLDEVGKDLSSIEAAQIAISLIEKIEDPQKRDDAIKEAARDIRSK